MSQLTEASMMPPAIEDTRPHRVSSTTTETVEAPAVPAVPATFQAADPLAVLLAEHGAQMVVGALGDGIEGWGAVVYGRIILVFPEGQDPAVRLGLARTEITRLASPETTLCGNTWCQETEPHVGCYGDSVEMASGVLHGFLTHDRRSGTTSVVYGVTDNDEDKTFTKGDDVRAETARVRAHLARLDLLADQLDAINGASGSTSGADRPSGHASAPDPGHFAWCAEDGCLVSEYPDGTVRTEHNGRRLVLSHELLTAQPGNAIRFPHPESGLLAAQVGFDEDSDDAPNVMIIRDGNTSALQGADLDAFIEQVATFRDGLAAMRAQVGQTHPDPA
ncbi:hypothetical protein ACIO6U_03895 [Streptomyces sp. NPDC087422]|uniref:hypothetical protein n=1 Tax=Streptomyces sp. NPDC087422 TaxID=3365786 RepID=UPI00382DBE30